MSRKKRKQQLNVKELRDKSLNGENEVLQKKQGVTIGTHFLPESRTADVFLNFERWGNDSQNWAALRSGW